MNSILRHGVEWRRLLQAGVVGISAAVVVKVCCQPELPESWRQRRTFTVVPADTKVFDAQNKALQMVANAAGLALHDLQRVVRSNWCGLELIAEVIAAAPENDKRSLAEQMAQRARRQNLLPQADDVQNAVASSRPRPETRRTYGVDVGGDAPLYLASGHEVSDINAALEQLRDEGLVILSAEAQHEEVRKALRLPGLGRPVREVPSREILALGCSAPLEPSAGRRHFLLRGTDFAEQVVVPLLAPIMPLCYRYFSENRPDASPGSFLNDGNGHSCSRLYLSECQLLVSDPGAVNQMWHCDAWLTGEDKCEGFNLGATMKGLKALAAAGGSVAPTPLRPGQALIYDARLMHRGLANSSYNRCRVVVVMRLDMLDTPPPGATVFQTAMIRALGVLLQGLSSVYKVLPIPNLRTA
ncbi:unnamed protein product [Cladocopium goreaui]|uniref:EF-hand domain-containing protein n=1 Tax=Cladocopium goreaui TaxID=2562237 RepID=A0A9P1BQW1_9DINO|nr:unnamed protein product [Cladocopium goreaui]